MHFSSENELKLSPGSKVATTELTNQKKGLVEGCYCEL